MVFHPFLFSDAFLKETKPCYLFFNLTVRFSTGTFSPVLFPRCLKIDCLKTFDQLFIYVLECIIIDSVILYHFDGHAPGILPGGQLDSN